MTSTGGGGGSGGNRPPWTTPTGGPGKSPPWQRDPNAPKGIVTQHAGRNPPASPQEHAIARLLAAEGNHVHFPPEHGGIGERPADTVVTKVGVALEHGARVEFKTPRGLSSRPAADSVMNALSNAMTSGGQASHLIIDTRTMRRPMTEAEARHLLETRIAGRREWQEQLGTIRIIGNGFDVEWSYN